MRSRAGAAPRGPGRLRDRGAPALLLPLLMAVAACAGEGEPRQDAPEGPAPGFVEVQAEAGVSFLHRHGGSGRKYMVETMGSGGGVLDYDGDGLDDLYLVQGGALPGYEADEPMRNALFRNNGDSTFTDVTRQAGADGHSWGMGFCAGDLDNDGYPEIYLSNLGPDILLRNNGDGSFTDATLEAGIDNPRWGASCAMADVNADGALDIYVTNYVDYTIETNKPCGDRTHRLLSYCHPDIYEGVSGIFFLNNGDGTFSDATRQAGLYHPDGKGLGAVFSDFDGDGDLDLYVANDSVANFLFVNDGTGRFTEDGLFAGVAYNENGQTQAGMGVGMGDVDGDGDPDIFVTNLDLETNAFYRNLGDGTFIDESFPSGVGEPSLLFVGFGTSMLDVENDGDLDLFVANGHILDDAEQYNQNVTYRQRAHLFLNDGSGRFEERGRDHGSFFGKQGVARGTATFDLEGDGDLDLLVTYNNGEARLLRNDIARGSSWLRVRLVGRRSNRGGIGAHLVATADGRSILREVQAGNSYLSQSSLVVHFGLGEAGSVESLDVIWPSGIRQLLRDLPVNRLLVLDEEAGVVGG